jgi:hypothetical protein
MIEVEDLQIQGEGAYADLEADYFVAVKVPGDFEVEGRAQVRRAPDSL